MDFLFDFNAEFFLERDDNAKIPEIGIVLKNQTTPEAHHKVAQCLKMMEEIIKFHRKKAHLELHLNYNRALLAKASNAVFDKVFLSGDPVMMKLYLNFCGIRLQQSTKLRESIRFLEAAKRIVLNCQWDMLHENIIYNLKMAYKYTGQHRKLEALDENLPESKTIKKVSVQKPFPVWQEQMAISTLDWGREQLGTSNSRAMSCELSSDGALVAKRDFDVGDLVFIEQPVVGFVGESKGQCNYCTLKTLYTVPCMYCCAVFYCCVECERKDEHYHRYECMGFQLLFFPIMDNLLVLRMMVKTFEILHQNLLLRNLPRVYPQTAQQLWDTLLEDHEHSEDFRKVLTGTTCNDLVSHAETYKIMLQKAKIVLHYIQYERQLLEDYQLVLLNVPSAEKNLFLESILLRLTCVVHIRACRFRYQLAYEKADIDEIVQSRSVSPSFISQMTIDSNDPEKQQTSELQNESETASNAHPRSQEELKKYWDACWAKANDHQSEKSDEELVENALKQFCDQYHSTFDFIEHLNQCPSAPNVPVINNYHGMYRFGQEMNSSETGCNTIFVLMDHGAVAFRAVKAIAKGEHFILEKEADNGNKATAPEEQDSLDKSITRKISQISDGDNNEEVRLICKIDLLSGYIKNIPNIGVLYKSYNFFDFLYLYDRFIAMFENMQQRSKKCAIYFKILNKLEFIYQCNRMVPMVLMQDGWMVELMKRRPKMLMMYQQNNKYVAHHLYNSFFKTNN